MEALKISSLGQPFRKSGETFSTLFLLTSSSLRSGSSSDVDSSWIQLLRRNEGQSYTGMKKERLNEIF